jgi:hypothetical protein
MFKLPEMHRMLGKLACIVLAVTAAGSIDLNVAQADMASWPQGCRALQPDAEPPYYEYDTSELTGVLGIDIPRLNEQLSHATDHYLMDGHLASPVGQTGQVGDRDRAIIIATLFPLTTNPETERLTTRGSGPGLGIIQPELVRSWTNDGAAVVMRRNGPADDPINLARSQTACITQSVAKVGLIECGVERYSPNGAHIREVLAIGLSPLIDVPEDNSSFSLVSSTDYLEKSVAACLNYLPGMW